MESHSNGTTSKDFLNEHKKPRNDESRLTEGKNFISRNSLVTDMFEISHINTLRHIFIAVLIILVLMSIGTDAFIENDKKIHLGLKLIHSGFYKIGTVSIIWLGMQLTSIFPYALIILRNKIHNAASYLAILDVPLFCFFIIFQLTFLSYPLYFKYYAELPIPCSFIVSTESTRMIMKMHAFVRSVSHEIFQNNADKKSLPTLKNYLYFMFAPTMIYSDSYPRTDKINWNNVLKCSVDIFGTTLFQSFLAEYYMIRPWENFGLNAESSTLKYIVTTASQTILPLGLSVIFIFYVILHCAQNISAELLRFADRQFYSDWWNQRDFSDYYRTWNILVHKWLHAYIYKEIISSTHSKKLAKASVFFISGMFHEMVLGFALGFFYPIVLIFHGLIGLIFTIVGKIFKHGHGNIFLWTNLLFGYGLMCTMYSVEYYARHNCPPTSDNKLIDVMLPRSWFCNTNFNLS